MRKNLWETEDPSNSLTSDLLTGGRSHQGNYNAQWLPCMYQVLLEIKESWGTWQGFRWELTSLETDPCVQMMGYPGLCFGWKHSQLCTFLIICKVSPIISHYEFLSHNQIISVQILIKLKSSCVRLRRYFPSWSWSSFNYRSSIPRLSVSHSVDVPMHQTWDLWTSGEPERWRKRWTRGKWGGRGKLLVDCRPRGYQLFISQPVSEWMSVIGGMVKKNWESTLGY